MRSVSSTGGILLVNTQNYYKCANIKNNWSHLTILAENSAKKVHRISSPNPQFIPTAMGAWLLCVDKVHKLNPILRCFLILSFSHHIVIQHDILPTVNPQKLFTPFCLCNFHACYMSSLFSRPLFVRSNNIRGTFIKCKNLIIKSARDMHYKSSPPKVSHDSSLLLTWISQHLKEHTFYSIQKKSSFDRRDSPFQKHIKT